VSKRIFSASCRLPVWTCGHWHPRRTKPTLAGAAGFIDQKQLLARLPITAARVQLGTTGIIPVCGWRAAHPVHWPSVEAALLRHQHGGQS